MHDDVMLLPFTLLVDHSINLISLVHHERERKDHHVTVLSEHYLKEIVEHYLKFIDQSKLK